MLFKDVWIHWRVHVMVGQLLGNSISVEDTRTSLVRYTSPVLLERESTLLKHRTLLRGLLQARAGLRQSCRVVSVTVRHGFVVMRFCAPKPLPVVAAAGTCSPDHGAHQARHH